MAVRAPRLALASVPIAAAKAMRSEGEKSIVRLHCALITSKIMEL